MEVYGSEQTWGADRLDADRIIPRLWQGSRPPKGPLLQSRGVDVVVLCANEHQPPGYAFPGVHVVHAPFDDDLISRSIVEVASAAAERVALTHAGGRRVLVTCNMGWNRSGLVNALALHALGYSGREASRIVRRQRRGALGNTTFRSFVEHLGDRHSCASENGRFARR